MFGNGLSSPLSNTTPPFDGPRFPAVTLYDNVACQHRLLARALGVTRIVLVLGWSMAGCQSYQWRAQYPDIVDAILPFCALARTSAHNTVFLEGVKAALMADAAFAGGDYTAPPEAGSGHSGGSMRDGRIRRSSIAIGFIESLASRPGRSCSSIGSTTISIGTPTTCWPSFAPGSQAASAPTRAIAAISRARSAPSGARNPGSLLDRSLLPAPGQRHRG